MADSHFAAYQLSNQLGQQALDINEAKLQNYKTDTLSYNLLQKADKQKASDDETRDVEKDIASVPKVYKTVSTFAKAGKEVVGGTVANSLNQGLSEGARVLQEGGEGSKLFATARFGSEGVTAVKELTGVEGIASRALLGSATSAAAETFAKVGGKALGEAGAAIDIGEDIDNLFTTGNAFKSVGPDGKVQEETTAEKWGNVLTIGAGVLDVAAAFTGGALAPIAAAANIAAATESTAASLAADQAQKKTDSQNPPPAKPPEQQAPAAFAQLGLIANQSHNPIAQISNR
jgi:hypothetical protein